MRIILVTTEYVTEEANFDGGLANYTYRTALSLKLLGHEPIVVVASNRCEVFIHKKIEIHRVSVIWYSPYSGYFNKYFPGMDWVLISNSLNREIRVIHRHKPVDVVQYTSLGATALFRVPAIPAVNRLSSYQKLWDEAYEVEQTVAVKVHQFLERKALKRVDIVFGPSCIIADAVSRDAGIEVELIESPFVLNVSENDETVYRKIADELHGRKYLLFFGSLGLLKGLKIIGDMIHCFFEKYPDYSFVFVGKDLGLNSQPAIDYLRKKAGVYRDRIIYRDKLPHSMLHPIIEHAHLIVLPSRVDNFPNTCVEAMALRKVVIGTRHTSFEQLILDRVSGFLCERDNPEDLLKVVDTALQLPVKQFRQIAEKAYQRTLELSPEIIVRKLITIYTKVLK